MWFRQRFADSGVDLEIPDLADGDFERLTISGQLKVLKRAVGGDSAVLMGSSMGGYLAALHAAADENVQRLVLLAPAFHFASRWSETLGETRLSAWRSQGSMNVFHYGEKREMPLRYDLLSDALNHPPEPVFSQPCLIFHGTRDDVVPPQYSQAYAAKNHNVKLRLIDSDHQLTDAVELIWGEASAFLLG